MPASDLQCRPNGHLSDRQLRGRQTKPAEFPSGSKRRLVTIECRRPTPKLSRPSAGLRRTTAVAISALLGDAGKGQVPRYTGRSLEKSPGAALGRERPAGCEGSGRSTVSNQCSASTFRGARPAAGQGHRQLQLSPGSRRWRRGQKHCCSTARSLRASVRPAQTTNPNRCIVLKKSLRGTGLQIASASDGYTRRQPSFA